MNFLILAFLYTWWCGGWPGGPVVACGGGSAHRHSRCWSSFGSACRQGLIYVHIRGLCPPQSHNDTPKIMVMIFVGSWTSRLVPVWPGYIVPIELPNSTDALLHRTPTAEICGTVNWASSILYRAYIKLAPPENSEYFNPLKSQRRKLRSQQWIMI